MMIDRFFKYLGNVDHHSCLVFILETLCIWIGRGGCFWKYMWGYECSCGTCLTWGYKCGWVHTSSFEMSQKECLLLLTAQLLAAPITMGPHSLSVGHRQYVRCGSSWAGPIWKWIWIFYVVLCFWSHAASAALSWSLPPFSLSGLELHGHFLAFLTPMQPQWIQWICMRVTEGRIWACV